MQKKCSNCNNIIVYKSKKALNAGLRNNSKCNSCRVSFRSQETIQKISVKNKGKKLSEATKKKLRLANLGKNIQTRLI